MSEVKHTPGPWTIDTDRSILAPENHASPGIHGRIAELYSWMGLNEAAANASLIAAAPALLEALKALLPEGWGDDDTMDHIPGVKMAREAIARAEGR
jgi:hypothetical protein